MHLYNNLPNVIRTHAEQDKNTFDFCIGYFYIDKNVKVYRRNTTIITRDKNEKCYVVFLCIIV